VRDFLDQFKQNNHWQLICGFQGNVPTQGQYSRRLPDQRLQEVLVRTFQTYQQLIPLTRHRYPFIPTGTQLEALQAGYYPFRMDCTSFKISSDRYAYATVGYVANEK
jgi:hypothetical protein